MKLVNNNVDKRTLQPNNPGFWAEIDLVVPVPTIDSDIQATVQARCSSDRLVDNGDRLTYNLGTIVLVGGAQDPNLNNKLSTLCKTVLGNSFVVQL